MSFKSYDVESFIQYGYIGFWIGPEGDVHPVELHGHLTVAGEILDSLDSGWRKRVLTQDVLSCGLQWPATVAELQRRGYVRLQVENGGGLNCTWNKTAVQPKTLKKAMSYASKAVALFRKKDPTLGFRPYLCCFSWDENDPTEHEYKADSVEDFFTTFNQIVEGSYP